MVAVLGVFASAAVIYIGFFGHVHFRGDRNRLPYLIAKAQVDALAQAVEHYRADCGAYPHARDGLNSLVADPGVAGWHGPYLPKPLPLDPWQRPYIYLPSGDSAPEILSYGADGKPAGEFFNADISSRKPRHSIPDSPAEIRANCWRIGIWIGPWLGLFVCVRVLIGDIRFLDR